MIRQNNNAAMTYLAVVSAYFDSNHHNFQTHDSDLGPIRLTRSYRVQTTAHPTPGFTFPTENDFPDVFGKGKLPVLCFFSGFSDRKTI